MSFKSSFLSLARSFNRVLFQNSKAFSLEKKDISKNVDTPIKFKLSETTQFYSTLDEELTKSFGKKFVSTHHNKIIDDADLDTEKLGENIDDQLKAKMAKALLKQNGSLSDHEIDIFNSPNDSEQVAELLSISSLREQCLNEMENDCNPLLG